MRDLIITEKTKVIKNEVEGFQKLLAKYRKQRSRVIEKQNDLKEKMNNYKWNTTEYKQASEEYKKSEKKFTQIDFYIKECKNYRKAWLELYAFNILKDNKEVIKRPLYYKREQERLFKHFDFEGLTFKVYQEEWTFSNRYQLVMYDKHANNSYQDNVLLSEEYLYDLSQMTEDNLRYHWQYRYITAKNFEGFIREKHKQIIKIAKKQRRYIEAMKKEQEELGDHFKHSVGTLSLDYAKDWQKYDRF